MDDASLTVLVRLLPEPWQGYGLLAVAGFLIMSGVASLIDAYLPQPPAGSRWVAARRLVTLLAHNYRNASNRIQAGAPRPVQEVEKIVDAAVRHEAGAVTEPGSVLVTGVVTAPAPNGGAVVKILLAGALSATLLLTACVAPGANLAPSTVDYAQIVAESQAAYGALKAVADAQVAAGVLPAAQVIPCERAAQAAVAALSASGGPMALSAQSIARRALAALVALQGLIPAGVLPQPVELSIGIAEMTLNAFLALDPGTAAQVRASAVRLTVPPPAEAR